MNFKNVSEFYPTPHTLLEKIFKDINWNRIEYILEPQAGKGDICDFITKTASSYPYYNNQINIDCIEISPELRSVLEGKEYRVIHDDFLTFRTFKKYDLIIMNPPFSAGVTHLLKALEISKNGGNIICILNAETIKNPFTNERKELKNKLKELNAAIEYYDNEFMISERPTKVSVAVIKLIIPEKKSDFSYIYENLRKKKYEEYHNKDISDIIVADYIKAAVQHYEMEVEAGINLINEYRALSPYILSSLKSDIQYNKPILQLKVGGHELSINKYIKLVRRKYWEALFKDTRFTGNMTSNQYSEYASKVEKLCEYDFSFYNIKSIQEQMSKTLIRGIEDCIIKLFDELSRSYSYTGDGTDKNIHYYNGWKTNKCWIINQKVIIPFIYAWNKYWGYKPTDWNIIQKLSDIEKALNYLDGRFSNGIVLENALNQAQTSGQSKNIQLKYFKVTFYKKGTMHIEFTNLELWKKFNIFGSQQKKWLPPAYGKKTYTEMDTEEKAVIDAFEGEQEYNKTFANANYYIYNPKSTLPMITESIS